jgi:alpha-beta hydrolase superfamily lysophospholipase
LTRLASGEGVGANKQVFAAEKYAIPGNTARYYDDMYSELSNSNGFTKKAIAKKVSSWSKNLGRKEKNRALLL